MVSTYTTHDPGPEIVYSLDEQSMHENWLLAIATGQLSTDLFRHQKE
jgi:hypothetical protein